MKFGKVLEENSFETYFMFRIALVFLFIYQDTCNLREQQLMIWGGWRKFERKSPGKKILIGTLQEKKFPEALPREKIIRRGFPGKTIHLENFLPTPDD